METMEKTISLARPQLSVLLAAYRFSFINAPLLAVYLKGTNSSIHNRLERLRSKGLLERRYDASYRLAGKAAEYYLTPASFKLLKSLAPVDKAAIKSLYSSKRAKQTIIDRQILSLEVNNYLEAHYPDAKILTTNELRPYDFLPTPRPQLFLRVDKPAGLQAFVYICQSAYSMAYFKLLIKKLCDYALFGGWPDASNPPEVFLVCDKAELKDRLCRYIDLLVELDGELNLKFKVTSL